MMLAEHLGDLPSALEQVRGSAAVALLRDGEPGPAARSPSGPRARCTSPVATGSRCSRRPASRSSSPARRSGAALRFEELRDGTMVELRDGEVVERRRFHVDSRFVGRRIVSYPDIPEKRTLVRLALSAFV